MGTGPTDVVAIRRQIHAVAESFIAGPQYRLHGTIRLTACPDGIAGVALPVSIEGARLVWTDRSAPLAGPVRRLVQESGIDVGPPPPTVYTSVEPLDVDSELDIDAHAAELLYRTLFAGRLAVASVVADQEPVLWPEHFDVGAAAEEVNYGVSAGDQHHPLPYAYVGPWTKRDGAFWNAPFGALHPLGPAGDIDSLSREIVDFFRRAQSHL